MVPQLASQPSLFDGDASQPAIGEGFAGCRRVVLAHGAWLDVVPGWLRGADVLFQRVLANTPWRAREVRMYERVLPEPRLTHRWVLESGAPNQLADPVLARMAELLSARYQERFTQVGANLYRDGADSVAWHGDRFARDLPTAIVALVSLGAVRPSGRGPSAVVVQSLRGPVRAICWYSGAPVSARGSTAYPRCGGSVPGSASSSGTPIRVIDLDNS